MNNIEKIKEFNKKVENLEKLNTFIHYVNYDTRCISISSYDKDDDMITITNVLSKQSIIQIFDIIKNDRDTLQDEINNMNIVSKK